MTIYEDEENRERAEMYKLFAALFIDEPPEELIEQVREMFQLSFNETGQDIALDFANTFFGPGEHLPPYESVYNYSVGETPGLWGSVTEQVQAFYNSVGLAIDEEVNLIPDHLSAELLFMAWLIESGRGEEQEGFIEDHLVKWVPGFCDELQTHAKTEFYREVAGLLKEFILSEYEGVV